MEERIKQRNRKRAEIWALKSFRNRSKEAVEAFADHPPGTYDAILMDVMMPLLNGIDAAKQIRAMDREDAKTIPIIAMTANALLEDERNCLEAGMNAHIAKPLDMQKVFETLSGCVAANESH